MAKLTMAIDLDACIGCTACEVACKQENDIPLGVYWNKIETIGPVGQYPRPQMYWMSHLCQNCYNPTCVEVCPTGATYQRDEDGLVVIDRDVCIGCQLCVEACPYGARSFDDKASVVGKCSTCMSLREEGSKPACVKCCTAEARIFGDIEDPESDISKAIAAAGEENVHYLPNSGTNPSVCYILHEKTCPWQDPA